MELIRASFLVELTAEKTLDSRSLTNPSLKIIEKGL